MTRLLRIATLIAIAITGVAATPAQTPTTATTTCPTPAAPPLRILDIGTSLTRGDNLTTPTGSDGYRTELSRLLDAACVPHEITIDAGSGKTCAHWTSRMAALVTTHQPDLILISCGTNDNLTGLSAAQVAAWEGMYRGLYDTALDLDPDVIMYPAFIQYPARLTATAKQRCTDMGGSPALDWMETNAELVNNAMLRAIKPLDEWHGRVPEFIDYQQIPHGYLDQCGVHPSAWDVMGRIAYIRLAEKYGWPAVDTPCGLTGRKRTYSLNAWTPCTQMAINP